MSNCDNEIRESSQHKTVVMLSSQLEGILTPPVRALKPRKKISILAHPSPFEKLKGNSGVLNANMDDIDKIDSVNCNASSLQHCENYISCVPIMKLSEARSCPITSDGTDSTNNCCSTELDLNAQKENVAWHIPTGQKHNFDSSISNKADENIDDDMRESDSESFSKNLSELSSVILTTPYENSAEDIAGTDSKLGVISSMLSMPDLGSEYANFLLTVDEKRLLIPYNDHFSRSDNINSFSFPKTNSEYSEMTNPQNCTSEETESTPSISGTIPPYTMRSDMVSDTDSATRDREFKCEQNITEQFSPILEILENTEFSRTPFIVPNLSTEKENPQMKLEISNDRFAKENPSQTDFSPNRHEISYPTHMMNPPNNRLAASSPNSTGRIIFHKDSRRASAERITRGNECTKSSSMAELSQTDFTVSRQTSEPSHIFGAASEEGTGLQHCTDLEKKSVSPEEHYSAILFSTTEGPSGDRGFDELQCEPVAIPGCSSMTDSSQSYFAVIPPKISQSTHILNPENRKPVSSQNSTADARNPTIPIRELYQSRGILSPKIIPTQTISHQTAKVPDADYENRGFNDWRSEQIITEKSSSMTNPSQTNSGVAPQENYQPTQTPISEENTSVRNFAAEESESAFPIREHPHPRVPLSSKSILGEAKSLQTIETSKMFERKSSVIPHGTSDHSYILNTPENNEASSSQYFITAEKESVPSVRGQHHNIDGLPTEMIHRHQTPKVLNVYQQKGDKRTEGSELVEGMGSYSMAKSSQSPTHDFHCGNNIWSISQNPSIGVREPASLIGEHNYSSAPLSSEMIPTQISSQQRPNSSHVYYENGNRRFEGGDSELVGTSRSFSMVDSSEYNVPIIPQELPQPIFIQNSKNSGSTISRNCTVRNSGPAHTLREHNYSILQSPGEMISTETLSPQTTKSLSFRERELWKSYQSATSRDSLMDTSPAIPPSNFFNPAQGRVSHLRDSTSEREHPFFRRNPNDAVSMQREMIPIQTSSNLNHYTASWDVNKTDFLQKHEESPRIQVSNYHNFWGQSSAPNTGPKVRNPVKRSRKYTLALPPSQTFPSPRANSWFSTKTKDLQRKRESFPSHRFHPYTAEQLSRNFQEFRAPVQQNYLPPPSLPRRAHAISNGEIVPNPYYFTNLQNPNMHHSKLMAALSYAPNICRDQIQDPSNISVNRRYPELHRYISHQESMYPRFPINTYYDEFGSTNPIKNPKQPRNTRCHSKSMVPNKTTRGTTVRNRARKEKLNEHQISRTETQVSSKARIEELNQHQISRTETQVSSKAVPPKTPLIVKTYYFFTNQNKKFRRTTEQFENELGSVEANSTKLTVITDEHTKYLAIVEGSTRTFKSLNHVESYQHQNTVVQKFGVMSTNVTVINEIVQNFLANAAAGLVEETDEIPTNATCQVDANENEMECIPTDGGSENSASVFPNNFIPQDIHLITLKQTDGTLQLILAIHKEAVCSQMGSVFDELKKKFESNSTVSLHEVLRIYFMDEESCDELVNVISNLLITEK